MSSRQRPAGESSVSEAIGRIAANSKATQPPRELPATCGLTTPASSSCSATALASAAGRGSTSVGMGGESPKPGRSSASTSNRPASTGTTGAQAPRQEPRPCSNTGGGPEPVRVTASEDTATSDRRVEFAGNYRAGAEQPPGAGTEPIRVRYTPIISEKT